MTPFGPQNANSALTLPDGTSANRYGDNDTFVRDCSSTEAGDGTVLDAAFFNRIIGNLNYVVTKSGVTYELGDPTALYRAIQVVGSGNGSESNGDAYAAIASESTIRATADEALASRITTLTATVGTNTAAISTEQSARATADTALAQQITSLTATVNGNTAAINSINLVSGNDNSALAQQLTTLQTTVANNTASISTEQTTRANADSALATRIDAISASSGGNVTFLQSSAPSTAKAGDLWIDTSNGNSLKRYSGTAWVGADNTQIATNTANIASESVARVSSDGSIASTVNSLSTTVAGYSASISQMASSVSGVSVKYGVQGYINGSTGGFVFTGVLKNDGSVAYNMEFNSNVTINGGLITGTVSSASISVLNAYGDVAFKAVSGGSGSNGVALMYNPTLKCAWVDNGNNSSTIAMTAYSYNGSTRAIRGYNSGSGIAIQGNTGGGSSGHVGYYGYDFYADGSGTNYGPFTGAHDAVMALTDTVPTIGDIVVDVECIARGGVSNTLCRVTRSTFANQKGTVGIMAVDCGLLSENHPPAVFERNSAPPERGYEPQEPTPILTENSQANWDSIKDNYRYVTINALGEGQINVCGQGGTIERGDLIVASSMPGKGMRQSDDIVRSYTVAKARETVTFMSASEIKTIACIYLCG